MAQSTNRLRPHRCRLARFSTLVLLPLTWPATAAAKSAPKASLQVPERWHREVLPTATADAWTRLAPLVREVAYLAGGTALALRLGHRLSRDLDFMLSEPIDLDELERSLDRAGPLAVSYRDEGTLNATFESTKVQFLDASGETEVRPGDRLPGTGR